jgi:cytochrome b subunit of formate dehydrogenase
MALTDLDIDRRRAAKRFNEGLKLLANTLNTAGLTMLVSGVAIPSLRPDASAAPWAWFPAAIVLHIAAQIVVACLRSED